MLSNILIVIIGISGGVCIAGAVFALITKIGVIPQIADVTHTTGHITTYETSILAGGILGNYITIFPISLTLSPFILLIPGICFGIFVGCLATALAETLDVTTIFTRRFRLHKGIQWLILSIAIGKTIGSLIYFINQYTP